MQPSVFGHLASTPAARRDLLDRQVKYDSRLSAASISVRTSGSACGWEVASNDRTQKQASECMRKQDQKSRGGGGGGGWGAARVRRKGVDDVKHV